jgi:hypothetical protein
MPLKIPQLHAAIREVQSLALALIIGLPGSGESIRRNA